MLRKFLHCGLHEVLEESLSVEVVGPHPEIFKLNRAMVIVPGARESLKKNQRTTRAVAELVLREIAGNRIHPCRKLLGCIEPMKVAGYADEGFLN